MAKSENLKKKKKERLIEFWAHVQTLKSIYEKYPYLLKRDIDKFFNNNSRN